jgi:predicted PurR-regulated permease PerM
MDTPDKQDAPAGTWVRLTGAGMTPAQRNTNLVFALLLFAGGLFTLRDFLPALAWAAVFGIALFPWFRKATRRWPRHKRELLPALFVLGVVLVFVVPLVMIAVPLASDAHDARGWLAQAEQNGVAPPDFVWNLPDGKKLGTLWQNNLGAPDQIKTLTHGAVHGIGGNGAKVAGRIGAATIHRVVLVGFMLLALFFLLRDADGVVEQLQVGSRRAFGEPGESMGRQIINSVHGTVNGLVLVGLGEGVLMGIAYVIAGVPEATLFGLLTAILAMVPYGATVAVIVVGAVLMASGSAIGALVILVLGLVVAFVADHFVRPVLIGGATRLPFIWVLLGILGGISAWGLVGLFVGPAIMAALILLWREWIGSQKGPMNPEREEVKGARKEASSSFSVEAN